MQFLGEGVVPGYPVTVTVIDEGQRGCVRRGMKHKEPHVQGSR